MDLFTLVAKLTLDPKEYEKEIKNAERKANSANIDATGKISVTDTYTAKLHQAESAAKSFDGDAEGKITADDKFSGAMDSAKSKADAFDAEANGTISADDRYSEKLESAETNADEADLDAKGDITADDQYSNDLADAEENADNADLNVEGEISADDQYSIDLSGAEENADNADLDAKGDITADDQYSEDLEDAEQNASDADLDAEGTISLEDDYSGDLEGLEADADSADLDVEGTATLEHSEFDNSITDMTEQVNGLDTLLKGLKVAGITTAIAGVASWAYGVVTDTVAYADRVDKTSQAIGLSYEAFQEWDHALSQSGASIEATKRGVMNMNDAMTGGASEEINGAYAALGIDPTKYTSKEALYNDTIMALAGMEAGADRDDIVKAIFGRNGTDLNPLLNSGPEEIQRLIDEAHELGLVMSDEDIKENVKLGDDIANLKQSLQALLMSVVSDVAPALITIVEFITDIIRLIRQLPGITDGTFETPTDALEYVRKRGRQMSGTTVAEGDAEAAEAESGSGGWVPVKVDNSALGTSTYYDPVSGRYLNVQNAGNVQTMTVSPESGEVDNAANVAARYGDLHKRLREDTFGDIPVLSSVLADLYLMGAATTDMLGLDKPSQNTSSITVTGNVSIAASGGATYQAVETEGGGVRLVPPGQTETKTPAEIGAEKFAEGAKAWYRPDAAGEDYEDQSWVYLPSEQNPQAVTNFAKALEAVYGRPVKSSEMQTMFNNGMTLLDPVLQTPDLEVASSTVDLAAGTAVVTFSNGAVVNIPIDPRSKVYGAMGAPPSHAKGLWDVPYDDYLASLHRDEMVLTASQAREYRDGGGSEDVVAAIQRLSNELANLQIVVGERVFGQTVVDYSGRRMSGYLGKAENRQYAGYGWG